MEWFYKYQPVWVKRLDALLSYGEQLLEACFDPPKREKIPLAALGLDWAIVFAGGFDVGEILNWGNIPFDFADWAEISAARIAFVQDAIRKGAFPLHMSEPAHLKNITDRYWVLPDTILAPQMILFAFLETGPFVYANTLFLYALATLGLIWFRKKAGLSLFVYSILFFLFTFNGHILSHLSIGHLTWWSYFLYPWLIALTFQIFEQKAGWRWTTAISLLMFLMLLQGGSHQFAWFILFFMVLGLSNRTHFTLMVKTTFFATLLAMVRILPPVLGLNAFPIENLGGYKTVTDLFAALIQNKAPIESLPNELAKTGRFGLGWWEFDLYIGMIGLVFLIGFGIIYWFRNAENISSYAGLRLPTIALIFFSIGNFYLLVKWIPFPMFTGERVASRIISVPFVILLFIAGICYQRWLSKYPSNLARILQLILLGLLFNDLWTHLKLWRVMMSVKAFPVTLVDLTIKVVGNHPDPLYTNVILVGAIISLLTLSLLAFLSVREWRLS